MKTAIITPKAPSAATGWRWNGRTRNTKRFRLHSDADTLVRIIGSLRAHDLRAIGVEVVLVPTPAEGTFDVYVPIKGA